MSATKTLPKSYDSSLVIRTDLRFSFHGTTEVLSTFMIARLVVGSTYAKLVAGFPTSSFPMNLGAFIRQQDNTGAPQLVVLDITVIESVSCREIKLSLYLKITKFRSDLRAPKNVHPSKNESPEYDLASLYSAP
jgi:hypothetical protein